MNPISGDDFLLTKNNFEVCTKNAFKNLINETEFSDVTLACSDEKQVYAHKVILSACSPFFKKIFRMNPHQHPLIYLKGVLSKDLEAILEFMYLGETKINKNFLDSFLNAAQELKVDGLIFPESEEKPPDFISNVVANTADKNPDYFEKNFKVETDYTSYDENIPNYEEFNDYKREINSGSFEENYEERVEKPEEKENEVAGKYKCDMCDVYITHKWNMMRHKVRVHGTAARGQGSRSPVLSSSSVKDNSADVEEQSNNPKMYSCDQCNFTSAHPTSIKRHIQAKHEGVRHKCKLCEFQASQTHDLKRHVMRVHPEEYTTIYN